PVPSPEGPEPGGGPGADRAGREIRNPRGRENWAEAEAGQVRGAGDQVRGQEGPAAEPGRERQPASRRQRPQPGPGQVQRARHFGTVRGNQTGKQRPAALQAVEQGNALTPGRTTYSATRVVPVRGRVVPAGRTSSPTSACSSRALVSAWPR